MDTYLLKLDLILDTITDGVLVVNSQGVVLYANQAAENLLARSPIVGQSLAIPINPDKNSHQDINLIRPDGFVWAEMRSAPLEWDGQPGYVIALRDITERKQAEMALRKADQHKDEFLAMLAHELRNPLAPISNAAHILDRLQLEDARLGWAKDIIKRQVTHLTHLVDDLLDVSRIARGKISLKKERLDLVEMIKPVLETACGSSGSILSKHQHLIAHLPEQPVLLDGDPVRLSQVLLNLLDNASKYSPEDSQIEVDVQLLKGEVEIQVRDNGTGIPAELLPTIFDLFQQGVRTLDRSQGGLGIGLTLVKRLVELHGGQVKASSPGAGLGSTFSVRLPRIDEAVTDPISESLMPSTGTGIRVLVVDDDPDVRESTALLLELNGYEVRMADSGEQAITLIEAFNPGVVLLDIGMPGENGYEVAQRIRRMPSGDDLLLIALSGYGQAEDIARSQKAGFHHHMVKPLNLAVLCELLSDYAGNLDQAKPIVKVYPPL